MATIGAALTAPEEGWKRYDDTHAAFKYLGAWNTESNAAYYGGSRKTTSKATMSNSISFKFKGTKLRYISSVYPEYSG